MIDFKRVFKVFGLYSLVFVSSTLFIALTYAKGHISPRQLGVALSIVCLFGFIIAIFLVQKLGREMRKPR